MYLSLASLHSPFYPSLKSAVILSGLGSVPPFLTLSFNLSIKRNMPSDPGFLSFPFHQLYLSSRPSLCHNSWTHISVIALQFLAQVLWMDPRGYCDQMLASCGGSCLGLSYQMASHLWTHLNCPHHFPYDF